MRGWIPTRQGLVDGVVSTILLSLMGAVGTLVLKEFGGNENLKLALVGIIWISAILIAPFLPAIWQHRHGGAKPPPGAPEPSATPKGDALALEQACDKAEFYAREYERANSELALASDELQEMHRKYDPPPPPDPPDKELLILFRRRGLPMFESICQLLSKAATDLQSSDDGGLRPMVGHLLRLQVIEPAAIQKQRAVESADGKNAVYFIDAFRQFCWDYYELVVWFGRLSYRAPDTVTSITSLNKWADEHDKFTDRLEDLTKVDAQLSNNVFGLIRNLHDSRNQLMARATKMLAGTNSQVPDTAERQNE